MTNVNNLITKNLVIRVVMMAKIKMNTREITMTIKKSTNDGNQDDAYLIESYTRNKTVADAGLDSTSSTAPLPPVSLAYPTLIQHA